MKKSLSILWMFLCMVSCKIEVPQGPFYNLKNEEVIAPMAYFDTTNFSSESEITFSIAIPEGVIGQIAEWKWEIQNIFDEIIVSSKESSFSVPRLPADDYIAICTITDKDKNSRVFKKPFEVASVEVESEYQLFGMEESQDTGYSDEDRITNINANLNILGKGPLDTDVQLRVKTIPGSTIQDFFGHTDATTGNVTITVDTTLADSRYECRLYEKDNLEEGSSPIFIIIDTTRPVLDWKNAAPTGPLEYGSQLIQYSKLNPSERLDPDIDYGGNFADVGTLEGFNPFVCGTQNLFVNARDRAGNDAVAPISRSLTISVPALPVLVNGSFDDATGMNGVGYVPGVGTAPGWTVSGTAGVSKGSWGENLDFTEVPFRKDWEGGSWKDYYCVGVRGD